MEAWRKDENEAQSGRFFRTLTLMALCLALLCGGALAGTVRGDLSNRFEEPPTLEKDGQTYQYRRGLETILFMGIDTRLQYDDVRAGFRSGGQSDFLLLLVIDKENETITPIHINRDVMTEITVLGVLGERAGTVETQLCLSHGFGDGKEQSCEYTCDAVREPLPGHRHRLLRVHEHGRHLRTERLHGRRHRDAQ